MRQTSSLSYILDSTPRLDALMLVLPSYRPHQICSLLSTATTLAGVLVYLNPSEAADRSGYTLLGLPLRLSKSTAAAASEMARTKSLPNSRPLRPDKSEIFSIKNDTRECIHG